MTPIVVRATIATVRKSGFYWASNPTGTQETVVQLDHGHGGWAMYRIGHEMPLLEEFGELLQWKFTGPLLPAIGV